MIRSLSRPSLLCSTATTLSHCHFSNRISRFKVRFWSAFLNFRLMLSQHVVLQMSVIVEITTEPKDAAVFVFLLRTLVSHWKQQIG
ncbi:hypothetical protein CsSME_00032802 [Camellia sinensis var. sinensis]